MRYVNYKSALKGMIRKYFIIIYVILIVDNQGNINVYHNIYNVTSFICTNVIVTGYYELNLVKLN